MSDKKNAVGTNTEIAFPEYRFVDTAFGGVNKRNNVTDINILSIPSDKPDCYVSMFRFPEDYQDRCKSTGSVSGASDLACWGDYHWFDIDSNDLSTALVNARQLVINIELIDPELIDYLKYFFSGAKGFHIGTPAMLFGITPSSDLPRIHKQLALKIAGDLKIDTSIYEKNRLWRLPNSKNSKSGLYKIPLTFDQLSTCHIDEILKLAEHPLGLPQICLSNGNIITPNENFINLVQVIKTQLENGNKARIPIVFNQPGWVATVLTDLENGNRNSTFAKVIGRLHRDGYQPEDIQFLLKPHAERVNFPINELNREITGVYTRYPNSFPISPYIEEETGTERKKLSFISIGDLLAQGNTEIEWLVDQLFPSEGVGIIAGPAGYGKTWMLMDLAIECACGGNWLGHFPIEKGKVLYVDEESSNNLVCSRFSRLFSTKEIPNNSLEIKISVGNGFSLSDPNYVSDLKQVLEEYKPNLVIFDSLIRVHRAEENSATDMARVFAVIKDLVREFECLFILADHQRKPGQFKISPEFLLRGSSEKIAFADTLLSIGRSKDTLVVHHSKSRFGETIPSFAISIEDPLPGMTSVIYKGDAASIIKNKKIEIANEFISENLSTEKWISRKELLELAKDSNISKNKLDEALKIFESENVVKRDDRKPECGPGGKSAYYRLISEEKE